MTTLPLGLACVAAATRKSGHEVAMVDLLVEKDTQSVLKETIEGFRPDIIGISVRNIDDQNMENPRFLLDPAKEIVAGCRSLSRGQDCFRWSGIQHISRERPVLFGRRYGNSRRGRSGFSNLDSADGAGRRPIGSARSLSARTGPSVQETVCEKSRYLASSRYRPLVFTISKGRTLDASSDQTRMSLEL